MSNMDSNVPYSLSDIHLPDSPSDIIKSSKSNKRMPSKLSKNDAHDTETESDNEVQTNGVKSLKKSKKSASISRGSDDDTPDTKRGGLIKRTKSSKTDSEDDTIDTKRHGRSSRSKSSKSVSGSDTLGAKRDGRGRQSEDVVGTKRDRRSKQSKLPKTDSDDDTLDTKQDEQSKPRKTDSDNDILDTKRGRQNKQKKSSKTDTDGGSLDTKQDRRNKQRSSKSDSDGETLATKQIEKSKQRTSSETDDSEDDTLGTEQDGQVKQRRSSKSDSDVSSSEEEKREVPKEEKVPVEPPTKRQISPSSSDNSASESEERSSIKNAREKISQRREKDSESSNSSSDERSPSEGRRGRAVKKKPSPKLYKRKGRSSSSPSSSGSRSDGSVSGKMSEGEIKDSPQKTHGDVKSNSIVTDRDKSDLKIEKSKTNANSAPPKKLKINRNNVVIPTPDKISKEEPCKNTESLDDKPAKLPPVVSPKEIQKEIASPSPESSESVEREMGEIIENETLPEIKYEPRKLNFRGRKLSRISSEDHPSEESNMKKSKWGRFATSRKSAQTINISTDSLKSWFPDFKLVTEPATPISEVPMEESPPIQDIKKPSFPQNAEEDNVMKHIASASKTENKDEEMLLENRESMGPVSKIVFIKNLVRPFTLMQLKELLKQTGNLVEEAFWIDKIKSKCFATYETEEDAIKTRNMLNGTRWPSSNPKILVAEFSTEEELEMHRSGIDTTKAAPEVVPQVPDSRDPDFPRPDHRSRDKENDRRRDRDKYRSQAPVREWDKDKVLQESPEKEIIEKEFDKKDKKDGKKRQNEDTPAKLLDDLFQKTKSIPCIYWLPLTESQVLEREELKRVRRAERDKKQQQREREREESEHRNKRPRRETDNRRSSSRSRSPTSRRR